MANLSKNLIGMVERGETNVSMKNIYKIASALNITLESLFNNF